MSIETRVITLSRAFRSLIWKTRAASKHIKDLKDLNSLRIAAAIDIKVLQTLDLFAGERTIDIKDLKDLKRRFFRNQKIP